MDFNQIQELIKLISETGLSEFKLEDKDFKLMIRSKDYFDAENVEMALNYHWNNYKVMLSGQK